MKLTAFAFLAAFPAHAATITEAPFTGTPLTLHLSDFTGYGPCGSGGAVIFDGCAPAIVTPGSNPLLFAQTPTGGINSQDMERAVWTARSTTPFDALGFTLVDARDQPGSWFTVSAEGAVWEIAARQENGATNRLLVLLDRAVTELRVEFSTRGNDGWTISAASIGVVPLPGALALLLAGVAGLAWRARG